MAVVAAVATAVVGTAVGGAVQAGKQHKAMRRARNEKEAAKWKVEELQASRQEITNPFAGVQSLSSMASDLSGQMSNPYASLGVATQAAEIQMEQSDIALANSLDTGASAGGATALAQAALRSKKGVSAGIEAQEATNEKLRAEGEAKLQQAKISEQQRLQSIAITEGQRVQAAEAQGNIFEFHAQEDRTNADLAYNIAKETGAQQRQAQARANRDSATSGIFTSIASSVATAGLTGGLGNTGP